MSSVTWRTRSECGLPPLSDDHLQAMHDWWRAANYLSVGQIYLMRNPLMRDPLTTDDVKPRLLGHWGTTPGLNFLYAHLNRIITEREVHSLFIAGPGPRRPGDGGQQLPRRHLFPGLPADLADEVGLQRLFKQFSFPGGIPSHVRPGDPRLDPRGR